MPKKFSRLCALWSGGVIGLYSFENDESQTETVNSDRYRLMMTGHFWHKIGDINVGDTDGFSKKVHNAAHVNKSEFALYHISIM